MKRGLVVAKRRSGRPPSPAPTACFQCVTAPATLCPSLIAHRKHWLSTYRCSGLPSHRTTFGRLNRERRSCSRTTTSQTAVLLMQRSAPATPRGPRHEISMSLEPRIASLPRHPSQWSALNGVMQAQIALLLPRAKDGCLALTRLLMNHETKTSMTSPDLVTDIRR